MRQFVADDSFYEEGWKAGKFLIFDERVWGRFLFETHGLRKVSWDGFLSGRQEGRKILLEGFGVGGG